MSELVKSDSMPSLQMNEQELIAVLQTSLYPGAKIESIKMVVSYCKAAGLDPMQKPVHIVPMKVSTGRKDDRGWDIKEDRDVIMPGIGLYRTQASRTGQYLGHSEPEFGPTKTLKFKEKKTVYNGNQKSESWVESECEYPEWCKVTIKRLLPSGDIAEYTAVERWTENYASKSASDEAPNAMWKKRPFGQLAKCAKAQALREAFPELGAAPTADEMEGKTLYDEDSVIDHGTQAPIKPVGPQRASSKPAEHQPGAPAAEEETIIDAETGEVIKGEKKAPLANENWLNTLRARMKASGKTEEQVLTHFKLDQLEGIDTDQAVEIASWVTQK